MFFMTYSNYYHAERSQIDKDTYIASWTDKKKIFGLIDRQIDIQLADCQAKEQVYRQIDS